MRSLLSSLTFQAEFKLILLADATGIEQVQIKWVNYEAGVVCRYGFELIGWPDDCPISNGIDNLAIPSLDRIISKINDGAIYWEEVPREELAIQKQNVPQKSRASRADKGSKRKARSESDAENEQPRATSSAKKPRSASIIDTSDEDESS